MSGTGTKTASATETFAEQVIRVTRPVLTDLLEIVEMYQHLPEDEAYKYVLDFREFLNERYLNYIEITWTSRSTGVVIDGLKYIIVNGQAVREMGRAGGLVYDAAIKNAIFNIRINYTQLWHDKSEQYKADFKSKLAIPWSPAASLNYGGGTYTSDGHSYGQASLGVDRLRFRKS